MKYLFQRVGMLLLIVAIFAEIDVEETRFLILGGTLLLIKADILDIKETIRK
jgi:hypothetical protein